MNPEVAKLQTEIERLRQELALAKSGAGGNQFGDVLRWFRKQSDMTIIEVAGQIGISKQSVFDLEKKDRPLISLKTLQNLAALYRVKVSDFVLEWERRNGEGGAL